MKIHIIVVPLACVFHGMCDTTRRGFPERGSSHFHSNTCLPEQASGHGVSAHVTINFLSVSHKLSYLYIDNSIEAHFLWPLCLSSIFGRAFGTYPKLPVRGTWSARGSTILTILLYNVGPSIRCHCTATEPFEVSF
jgi:hypothetical protein